MTTREGNVVVIGSGLGGLAAACTLAARGHRVQLLEKNPWLGGKAAVLEQDGFRFDMGPTIMIMPSARPKLSCERSMWSSPLRMRLLTAWFDIRTSTAG